MPPHNTRSLENINRTLATNKFTALPDVNPFDRPVSFFRRLGKAFLATAICRCWQHVLFFTVEAFTVVWVCKKHRDISIQNTLYVRSISR
jgi:hypothetical protein